MAVDVLLAAALIGPSLVVIAQEKVTPAGSGWDIARGVAIVVACLPLPFRHRYPLPVLATVSVGTVALASLGARGPAIASVGFAIYTVASTSEHRLSPVVVGAPIVAIMLAALRRPEWGWLLAGPAVILAGWWRGERTRSHRAFLRGLEDRAAERAQQAAFEERLRIARELHDIVAHSMSVIAVRSGVARMVLDTQPAEAREALGIIETTSRQALQEMRNLVGVLREPEDAGPELAPYPGLDDLPNLVQQAGQGGLTVDVNVTGDPRPLPTGVDVSAYRIIQEALTNVVRHAGPAKVLLAIRYVTRAVEIEVVDDGAGRSGAQPSSSTRPASTPNGSNPGHGLVGMQERVNLYGGDLSVGPFGRGFRVLASLPTDGETS